MTDDIRAKIERVKDLDQRATKGPWTPTRHGDVSSPEGRIVVTDDGIDPPELRDAILIAEYRTLAPQIAVECEGQMAENRRLVAQNEDLRARLAQQTKLTSGQQRRADKLGRQFDRLQADWAKTFEECAHERQRAEEAERRLSELGTKAICVYCDHVGPRAEMASHVKACPKRDPSSGEERFVQAFTMRDEAAKMLNAAEKLLTVEWQDIETAPKDGREIIGLCYGKPRVICWDAVDRVWRMAEPLFHIIPPTPTHWQPLPLPPKEET